MMIKWVSLLLFLISIFLFMTPIASALGDYTISLDETFTEDDHSENQTSLTIYMYGAVEYTGYSISGDTIFLSSSSDIGKAFVSPQEVTFYSSGGEEFIVELTIQNDYENGTTVNLSVSGIYQQGGTTVVKSAQAQIHLSNHSYPGNNDNSINSENHQKDGALLGFNNILMISLILIITAVAIIIYKKYIDYY